MNLRIKIDDFYPKMQPKKLGNLRMEIELNIVERLFLVDISDVRVDFWGDAYRYLKNSRDTRAYDGVHTISIEAEVEEGTFGEVFRGEIYLAECEFDLTTQTMTTVIADGSYNSKIKTNRNIKANLMSNLAKNGGTIAGIAQETVTLFQVGATPILRPTARVLPVLEVFNYLTKFMTDNELSFESKFMDDLMSIDNLNYGLVTGRELRAGYLDIDSYVISFQELLQDFARAFNLLVGVDNSTGVPVIRMEKVEYFRNSSTATVLENVKNIKMGYVEELLYNRVKIGDKDAYIDGTIGDFPYFAPFDFGEDFYYIEGTGNIDSELDLTPQTVRYDNNTIQDIIENNNDEFDKDWFIVAYVESSKSCVTPNAGYLGNGSNYYNMDFTNVLIIDRYSFSGGVIKNIGDGSEDMEVWRGSDKVNISPNSSLPTVQWTKAYYGYVEYDTGSNFFNSEYTATAGGVRNVHLESYVQMTAEGQPSGTQSQDGDDDVDLSLYTEVYLYAHRLYVNGVRWTGSGTSQGLPSGILVLKDTTYVAELKSDYSLYLNPADVLDVRTHLQCVWVSNQAMPYLFPNGNKQTWGGYQAYVTTSKNSSARWTKFSNSIWRVDAEAVLSGIRGQVENNYFVDKLSCDSPISQKDIIKLINNPQDSVVLRNNKAGLNSNTWAYNISLNLNKGEGKFELITNINNL